MACDFIVQLSKLRKSSAESVENTDKFDDFKKYLHVERQVEIELRKLLKEIKQNEVNKCLVLVCGSAGDGKSHLISYLKNSDGDNLLDDYEPYNDATESSAPTLTSIDTLAQKLVEFDDDHYDKDNGKKMIIAINLGTLNNFIESDKGKNFSKLREYVEKNNILSSYAQNIGYQQDSVFQHVSFADYQVFSLTKDGVETSFLEKLLEKVFAQNTDNPFYEEYQEESTCSYCKRCPVRHNFEFLSDQIQQKALIRRIVQAVIMDKTIVSTRDVLNLLYDLIVHPSFNESDIGVEKPDVDYITNYISWTTPMLLNEYDDISPLVNAMKKHDILKHRNATSDEAATRFHSLENIENIFNSITESTPYSVLSDISNVSELGGKKPELKKIIYRFITRLQAMKDYENNSDKTTQEQRIDEYLKYLYEQNSGNEQNLRHLYEATKRAVLNWDGEFGTDEICIDDSNEQFWILEQLILKAAIDKNAPKIEGEIQRFSPIIRLRYRKEPQGNTKLATIRIDFALFELIANMRDGYRPTMQDKNRHTDFVSFIQQLIELGNKDRRVIIVPKDSDKKYRMIFEETDFGYEFKVVR